MPYKQNSATNDIMVFLQVTGGHIHQNSLELAAAAHRLAAKAGGKVTGVLAAAEWTAALENEVCGAGLHEVDVYLNNAYSAFMAEVFCLPVVDCIERKKPASVLIGATPEGRALAPTVAVPLETGVTADCTELETDATGQLVQTRPAYGGSIMAKIITPTARPQIATVRYSVLKAAAVPAKTAINFCTTPQPPSLKYKIEKLFDNEQGEKSPEFDIIIALGGALKSIDDLPLFEKLAQQLGAGLMCSRSLVERGWMPHKSQIGLSGKSISPALLITLGVSGSVQFLAGVQNAAKICAINTDEEAPIMKKADTPLVGDIYEITEHILKL